MTHENFPPATSSEVREWSATCQQRIIFTHVHQQNTTNETHTLTSKSKCSELFTLEGLAQVQFIITLSCQFVVEWVTFPRLPGVFASVSNMCIVAWWWLSPQALAIPNLCIEDGIGTEHVQKLLLSKALFVLSHSKRWWNVKWPWRELMKFFHVAVWLQHANKF